MFKQIHLNFILGKERWIQSNC